VIRKESNDGTREQIEKELKKSEAEYADFAENRISMLQKAYLKKYHPRQYHDAHSTDAPNKRFGGKVSALFRSRRDDSREPEPATPTESEEGIADITWIPTWVTELAL
jgi:hypothetical protein